MKYKKGQSGNPAGKPKGTKNTKTIEWEDFGKELLNEGSAKAKRILSESTDDNFMKYYIQLIEYFAPKQSRIESTSKNDNNLNITIDWDTNGIINQITETPYKPNKSIE